MKVAVIGGKLQGVEALYLANQAGWDTVLVDRKSSVPGKGLCQEFSQIDVTTEKEKLKQVFSGVDLIIPALENRAALSSLNELALQAEVPLAFDRDAYTVTSSKLLSDQLFHANAIPAPAYYPQAKLPLIVKPSGASGSKDVLKLRTQGELERFERSVNKLDEWVVQEYLTGPSYSLEVIGLNGEVVSYQVTEIVVDAGYDCKRVLAPVDLDSGLEDSLRQIAAKIAELLNLTGIMDVEVINHKGSLRVLEIDARLPSQTPITIWHSTGLNMVEHLMEVFVQKRLPKFESIGFRNDLMDVIFEHLQVSPEKMEIKGEHIMTVSEPLQVISDFWGADQAITNFHPGRTSWVATFIYIGRNRTETRLKRRETLKNIAKHYNLSEFLDLSPAI
ncbi:MAG: 3-methylornithine--L-lysine ligase PylC [Bacillota bacterium]|nr:3-methylornithine--L-lysine ligase PylC [Bacillota bacterium]